MAKFKLRCPEKPEHSHFSVTAHVTQEWLVDQDGEFVDVLDDCVEVTHTPDSADLFLCDECCREAQVYDEHGNLVR